MEIVSVKHKFQKYIIEQLIYQKAARFSELRPPRVNTNLFTYHLNNLVKRQMVTKTQGGYTLSPLGMLYVDTAALEAKRLQVHPKIITMLVIQNSDGDVLLEKRTKQPYIDTWTLPYGKVGIDNAPLELTAQRVAREKLQLDNQAVEQAGDCYIRVHAGKQTISTTLVHVFRFYKDDLKTNDGLIWVRPHKLHQLALAPAVEEIMARTFFKDSFYFEEYDVDWYSQKYDF